VSQSREGGRVAAIDLEAVRSAGIDKWNEIIDKFRKNPRHGRFGVVFHGEGAKSPILITVIDEESFRVNP
jgi:hypothetical protein